MMLVDSHCHLNFPDFKDDLDAVVQRAREAGVGVMQTICTELAEFEEVHAIAARYEDIYCSIGVHPNESGNAEMVTLHKLIDECSRKKVIGIGETGLDYHYEMTNREVQKASFRVHIDAARETGLPLIIHARQADEDMAAILAAEMARGSFKALLHCFTSSRHLAQKAIELGVFISISGIASFKNATELHEIIREIPIDMLLVETDAPYLAPIPHRGKRNEPCYTVYTNRKVAELKSVSEEKCATYTTENFFRLFGKASRK